MKPNSGHTLTFSEEIIFEDVLQGEFGVDQQFLKLLLVVGGHCVRSVWTVRVTGGDRWMTMVGGTWRIRSTRIDESA